MDEEKDSWSLKIKSGDVIWKGKLNSAPSIKDLSLKLRMLDDSVADEAISNLASQVVRSCQVKFVPVLLSALACHFWRNPNNGDIDVNLLLSLPSSAEKPVCGMVFKKGDLAWNCRTCGKDQTCVQCDKCFRNSDHQGHEVFFHRSSGDGGCCDCGDPEAWATSGNCCLHGGVTEEEVLKPSLDPIKTVPPELTRGLRAVLSGTIGTILSFITCNVRGFQPYERNPFIKWCNLFEIDLVGRLHDDEIHSYTDVDKCLNKLGYNDRDARILTSCVDKTGQAIACVTGDQSRLEEVSAIVHNENLLFSLVPQDIVNLEPNILAVFNWFQSMGSGGHSGLRCVITEILMKPLDYFPTDSSVLECEDEGDDDDSGDVEEDVRECMFSVAPDHIFDDDEQFPSIIPQLSVKPSTYNLDDITVYWSEYIAVNAKPFDRCPKVAFAVFVMASPYLSKPLKNAINSIVIYFQHDNYFKFAFSQLFMLLYPSLYSLYVRFIGIQTGNIFNTSVQVFTANSIVDSLSSDGFDTRVFPEPEPKSCLTSVLIKTLRNSLAHTGCYEVGAIHKMFLLHPAFKNSFSSRLSHLFRDIDYVLKSPIACSRILAGLRDPDMFDELVEIYACLQNLDSFRRETNAHVEREDDQWSTAINLVLEAESISADLISHAFFPFISPNAAWGYTNDMTSSSGKVLNTSKDIKMNAKDDTDFASVLQLGLLTALKKVMNVIHKYFSPESNSAETTSDAVNKAHMSVAIGNTNDTKSSTGTDISTRSDNTGYSVTSFLNGSMPSNNFFPSLMKKRDLSVFDIDSTFYFFQATEPVKCLDHMVVFPGIMRYYVSHHKVSMNIPLQRLVSKLFSYACMGGLDVYEAINYLKNQAPASAVQSIADYPLRCISFVTQVNCAMWRKNGSSTANLAFNYCRPIFSKTLRYADLHAIQVGILALGPDSILALALDRFEVLTLLEDISTYSIVKGDLKEYKGSLLAEFLKFLSNLILYVPTILLESFSESTDAQIEKDETLRLAVAREVVHHVLAGEFKRDDVFNQLTSKPVSFSKLLRVKNIVGTPKHVNEALIKSISEEYCNIKSLGIEEEESAGYELNDKGYELIDPEFSGWWSDDLQKATEMLREYRKRKDAKSKSKIDDNYQPVISIRAIPSAHPAFIAIRSLLYRPLLFTTLERSLNLCLSKPNMDQWLSKSVAKITNHVIQLVTLQIHCFTQFMNDSAESHYYSLMFHEPDKDDATEGLAYKLLLALAEVWNTGLVRDDEYYHSGLGWVLRELAKMSPDAKSILERKGISFEKKSSTDSKDKATLAQKKAAAQQRALAAMNKQAMNFSAGLDSEEDDDDKDGDDESRSLKKAEPTLEDGALECIVCRDKCNDVMGYLCYIQPSQVLKNAILQNKSDPLINMLSNTYRVTSLDGCNVHSKPSELSSVITHLSQGTHVTGKQRSAHWVEIISPSGWCPIFTSNVGNSDSPYALHLSPVQDIIFNKHGGTRVHVSSCGHMMHAKCWESFRSKTNNLTKSQLDVTRGCRTCPFCKGICNSLLPHIPPYISVLPTSSNSSETIFSLLSSKLNTRDPSDLMRDYLSTMMNNSSSNLNISLEESVKRFNTELRSQYKFPWDPLTRESFLDPAVEIDGIGKMKALHIAWSATAYTILCTLSTERSVDTSEDTYKSISESSAKEWKTYRICSQMLSSTRSLTLSSVTPLIIEALCLLLSGQPSHLLQKLNINEGTEPKINPLFAFLDQYKSSKPDLLKMLLTLPFLAVGTNKMPDDRRLCSIIQLFYEMQLFPDNLLWSLLSVPLLSQDLHVITIAAISTATNLQSLKQLCGLLSLARLVQTLIEPSCTGVGSSSTREHLMTSESLKPVIKRQKSNDEFSTNIFKSSNNDILITSLISLRATICDVMRIQLSPYAPTGIEFLQYVADSWIGFLEFTVNVKERAEESTFSTSSDSKPSTTYDNMNQNNTSVTDSLLVRINSILPLLGLPLMNELLQSPTLMTLACTWSKQLRLAYSTIPSATIPESSDQIQSTSSSNGGAVTGISNVKSNRNMDTNFVSSGSQKNSTSSPDESILMEVDNWNQFSPSLMTSLTNSNLIMVNLNNQTTLGGEAEESDDDGDENNMIEVNSDHAEFVFPNTADFEMNAGNELMFGGGMEDILQQLGLVGAEGQIPPSELVTALFQSNQLLGLPMQTTTSTKKVIPWRLTGIDPTYPYFDETLPEEFSNRDLNKLHSISPFMASITGTYSVYSVHGNRIQSFLCDFSHMGLRRHQRVKLVELPNLYTDIYHMTKFPEGEDKPPIEEPCICLICGRVINAANRKTDDSADDSNPGECTLHARVCSGGTGVFFLVQHLSVLFIHRSYASYYPSLYLDSNGETDRTKTQNRPMFLSAKRYRKIEEIYSHHQIPVEVTRNRISKSSAINLDWY